MPWSPEKKCVTCIWYFLSVPFIALSASSIVFLIGRMVKVLEGGGPKIASRALFEDLIKGAAMAVLWSSWMMVYFSPLLAPSIWAVGDAVADWRWIFVL